MTIDYTNYKNIKKGSLIYHKGLCSKVFDGICTVTEIIERPFFMYPVYKLVNNVTGEYHYFTVSSIINDRLM